MPLPLLPRNINDPTGQDRRERGAINQFTLKMRQIGRGVKAILDALPVSVITLNAAGDELKRYNFNVDTIKMDLIASDISALIDEILLQGGSRELWFLTQYVAPSYQQGTAMAQVNLATQSSAYALSRPTLESVLLSPAYRTRLGYLRAREWEEMKGLAETTKTGMTRILFSGMAQGINPNVIATQLAKETDMDIVRARRIARTEINTAFRQARLDEAEDAQITLGILTKMMQISALSATTRPSHAARHAKLYTIAEVRVWMSTSPNMINCYLPGARVRGRFVAGSKAWYEGPAVRAVTANGNDLAVTPNHPVMTNRGLIAAAELREGDHLVTYRNEVEAPAGIADLHGKLVNARIEDVFSALVQLGETRQSRVRAIDFHGDGEFIKKGVDVVSIKRALPSNCDAALAQTLDNLALEHADTARLKTDSSTAECIGGVGRSSSRLVRLCRPLLATLRRHLGMFHECRAGAATVSQSEAIKPAVDVDATGPGSLADSEDGFAEKVRGMHLASGTLVELDVIASIERFAYHGFVYDLEEKSGLMVANNIVASNCKCSFVEVLVNDKGLPLTPGVVAKAEAQR